MRNRVAWGLAVVLAVVVSAAAGAPETKGVSGDVLDGTPLMLAALSNDTDRVKSLLSQGVDVNAKDENGMTALMWAAPHTAPLLIEGGANIDARDNFGRTALTYAAYQGFASKVRTLLDHKAEVDPEDSAGRTPLFWAIEGPVLFLCFHRNPTQYILLVLSRASRGQETKVADVVFLLLDRGANPKARDRAGDTPLLAYSRFGLWGFNDANRLIPKYLLAKGADINARDSEGNSALMLGVMGMDVRTVKLLLENGADVNVKRRDGRTAQSLVSETHWGSHFPKWREQMSALLKEAGRASEARNAKQP